MQSGTVRAANPSQGLFAIEADDGSYVVIRTGDWLDIGDVIEGDPTGSRLRNATRRHDLTHWEVRGAGITVDQLRTHLFPPS